LTHVDQGQVLLQASAIEPMTVQLGSQEALVAHTEAKPSWKGEEDSNKTY